MKQISASKLKIHFSAGLEEQLQVCEVLFDEINRVEGETIGVSSEEMKHRRVTAMRNKLEGSERRSGTRVTRGTYRNARGQRLT